MMHSGHFQRARRHLAQAVTLGVSALLATQAFAQGGQIEEVVVTAQKRAESQQEVPIAISTLSSAVMEKQGIYNFTDIVKTIPSLSETAYPSSNMLILYMRGQGVSDPMQITSDGSVGVYVDGHYISRPQGALFDIADTERVEVLRGPQGTLYGRNTTGGAVNLITRKPSGEFGLKQSLSAGNRDFVRSLTVIDLPEMGGVASKVSILRKKENGFVKNIGGGHDFGGETDEIAGRVALHWSPCNCDTFDVDYALDIGSQDSTPIYYAAAYVPGFAPPPGYDPFGYIPGYIYGNRPTNRTYRPFDLRLSTLDFEGHGLTLTWQASENLTIKSLTGYRELDFDGYQDYAESFMVPARSWDAIDNYQFTQEFQFIGSIGDSIQYVGGLFYFHEMSTHFQNWAMDLSAVPPPAGGFLMDKYRDVKAETTSHAAYAQATWTPPVLDNRLDLTLGARFTKDRRKAHRDFTIFYGAWPVNDLADNRQSFSRFNPAFTANFAWTDTVSTYAKVTTGYKAGGSSEAAAFGQFDQTFNPEDVTTWELGLKSDWLDRSLRVNAALFYSEFEDMQLAFVADAADTSVIQAYNAGKANVTGAEFEITWLPTTDLQFRLDYAYLDPKFDEVKVLPGTIFDPAMNPVSPHHVGDNIKDLFTVPYAPRNTLFASVDYTFWHLANGDLSVNVNYHRQSNNYISAPTGPSVPGRHAYRQNGYGVVDARVTLDLDLADNRNLQLAVWGHNITNREYRTSLIGLGGGGAAQTATSALGYTYSAVSWAPPPSYGAEVIFKY